MAEDVLDAQDEELKTTQGLYNTFVEDFCKTYADVLPLRTEFVSEIYQIDDKQAFDKACLNSISTKTFLNTWYTPIDPQSSITPTEICELNYKLFTTLRQKQRSSLSEYVSFSYLASLDLFLNAQMQEDYENCVNTDVMAESSEWATKFVTSSPSFYIWDNTSKHDAAAQTGHAINQACADKISCAATG